MKKHLLVVLLILFVVSRIAYLMFSGSPGPCSEKLVKGERRSYRQVLNLANHFVAGDIDQLKLSEDEVTRLFREKLDPRMENFNVCFTHEGVSVSGSATNKVGMKINYLVLANIFFDSNHVELRDFEFSAGRLNSLPSISRFASGRVEKAVRNRLTKVSTGPDHQVQFSDGFVLISRTISDSI